MKIEKGKRGRKKKERRGLSQYHSKYLEHIGLGLMPCQLCLTRRLTLSAQGVCRAVSAVEYCLKQRNHIILSKQIPGYRQILNHKK